MFFLCCDSTFISDWEKLGSFLVPSPEQPLCYLSILSKRVLFAFPVLGQWVCFQFLRLLWHFTGSQLEDSSCIRIDSISFHLGDLPCQRITPSVHYHCSVVLQTSAFLEWDGERKLRLQGIGFDESVGRIKVCCQSIRWRTECAVMVVLSFSHKINFKTLTSA